jgi:hypothetical protein
MRRDRSLFCQDYAIVFLYLTFLDFEIVPMPNSWLAATATLATALLASAFGPPSKLEWAAIILIHAILIILLAGTQSSHCRGVYHPLHFRPPSLRFRWEFLRYDSVSSRRGPTPGLADYSV